MLLAPIEHLALSLITIHSAAAFKLSYSSFEVSFRYLLNRIEYIFYSYRIFIASIAIGKWGPLYIYIYIYIEKNF